MVGKGVSSLDLPQKSHDLLDVPCAVLSGPGEEE